MRRCRRQAPPFSGSAPTTFRLYRYSNEGRPSGSGRNSYVSSNYSNFLSQNSRRKLPRSSPPRRKRNRRLRPPRGDLRPRRITPVTPGHPIRATNSSVVVTLCFPSSRGRSRKANAQVPSPLFLFAEFHPLRRDRGGCDCEGACATPRNFLRKMDRNEANGRKFLCYIVLLCTRIS